MSIRQSLFAGLRGPTTTSAVSHQNGNPRDLWLWKSAGPLAFVVEAQLLSCHASAVAGWRGGYGWWKNGRLLGGTPSDVSENKGTPKSSILIGFSIINHPFWGTSIFGNTHLFFWFGVVWWVWWFFLRYNKTSHRKQTNFECVVNGFV